MLLPSFLSHGVEHYLLSDDALDEGAHVFDGVALEVVDEELLRQALCCGIGRAKAFGCGLMTIAPLP